MPVAAAATSLSWTRAFTSGTSGGPPSSTGPALAEIGPCQGDQSERSTHAHPLEEATPGLDNVPEMPRDVAVSSQRAISGSFPTRDRNEIHGPVCTINDAASPKTVMTGGISVTSQGRTNSSGNRGHERCHDDRA
jgi:hypothetical protein